VPFFAMRTLGMKFRFTLDTHHPGVKKVFKLMLPVVLGLSLPGVYGLIIRYFGTLYPEGVNSALDASNKIMQAPLGVFGQSLAIAAFPAMSQFFAQKRMDAYCDQLVKTIRTVIYLAVPISAIIIAMPEAVIQVLLQHGAFKAVDTARTAPALQMFALGIVAWCAHPVLMRAFFAVQKSVTPIVLGTLTTLFFLFACNVAIALKWDYPVLPLVGSVSAVLLIVMMLVAIKRETPDLNLRSIMTAIGQTVLAGCVCGGFALAVSKFALVHLQSKALLIPAIIATGLVASWLYIWVTKAMGMPETAYIDRAMKRLDRKGKPSPDDNQSEKGDEGLTVDQEVDIIDHDA